jgi:flagellar hook protein FlgE
MGGISSAQTQLQVVSNNVANMNTIAFKQSNVTFQELFCLTTSTGNSPTSITGGKNPMQVGVGVQVGTIAKDYTSGTWTSTGKTTDMMIQGNGFFTVKSSTGEIYLTRAGNFTFDANGDMVNPQGYKILGADKIFGTSSSDTVVHVPQHLVPTTAADASMYQKPLSKLNNCSITSGDFYLTTYKNGAIQNTDVKLKIDTATYTTMGALATDLNNQLTAAGLTGVTCQCDDKTGGTIKFICDNSNVTTLAFKAGDSNFLGQTQLGSAVIDPTTHSYSSKVLNYTVDVSPVTSLDKAQTISSYSIAEDGSIEATYSNGDKLSIQESDSGDNTFQFKYTTSTGVVIRGTDCKVNPNVAIPANFQIQLANVTNVDGLVDKGTNLYMSGPNSGDMIFTSAAAMGLGSIKSGGLEASNVDISKQFSDMILAQRAVESNSRVFTSTNNILQTLVRLGE